MIPALSFVDGLAHDVAADTRTTVEALAILRARGLTPDREQLAEAVAAIQLRDRFLARRGDPYAYVGLAGPRAGHSVDAWDLAVRKAEEELGWALRALARPAAVAGAA